MFEGVWGVVEAKLFSVFSAKLPQATIPGYVQRLQLSSMAAVVHSYDPEEVALSGVLKKCCSMWARVPELGRGSDVEAMPVMIFQ